jgi:hypothetical protein
LKGSPVPQEAFAQDSAILRRGKLRHSPRDRRLSGQGEECGEERGEERE